MALVGESGSGKSVTALSVMQLLPYPMAQHPGGSSIPFKDRQLIGADPRLLRDVRGDQISLLFTQPLTSLNPPPTAAHPLQQDLFLHTRIKRATEHRRPHDPP